MKRKILTGIAAIGMLACLGAGSVCAFAQEPVGDACLCVTGTASVEAEADACTFGGCVEGVGNDARAAEKAAAALLRAVKNACAAYGTVREESSSVYPAGKGYAASKYLIFETEKADKAEEMRAALAETGVTCLEGARYFCKEDGQYKLEALQKAVENAREKAKALGAAGALVRVEEHSCYPCARGESAGTVTFTATVRAVFAKLPHAPAKSGHLPKAEAPAEAKTGAKT